MVNLDEVMMEFVWDIREFLCNGQVCLRCDYLRGMNRADGDYVLVCESYGGLVHVGGVNVMESCSQWKLHKNWENYG